MINEYSPKREQEMIEKRIKKIHQFALENDVNLTYDEASEIFCNFNLESSVGSVGIINYKCGLINYKWGIPIKDFYSPSFKSKIHKYERIFGEQLNRDLEGMKEVFNQHCFKGV